MYKIQNDICQCRGNILSDETLLHISISQSDVICLTQVAKSNSVPAYCRYMIFLLFSPQIYHKLPVADVLYGLNMMIYHIFISVTNDHEALGKMW